MTLNGALRRRISWRYYTGMADRQSEQTGAANRLDKWLWCARFYKTRGLASDAIAGGKVHLNGARVKPAHRVAIGDRVSVAMPGITAEFDVLGLPVRRGPAAEAQTHFRETPQSAERRLAFAEQMRIANQSRPQSDGRPDKRDRRRLMRWQRDQT
jgi:ribosome-associated heat shock protein Hsp15